MLSHIKSFLSTSTTIYHGYGPAETTFLSSYHRVKEQADYNIHDGLIPVGKPKYTYKYYILDQYDKQVPIGQTGEILISGMFCTFYVLKEFFGGFKICA